MRSILQSEKRCYMTHRYDDGTLFGHLDKHHIYFGANRKVSEENGFWIWLRHDYHIADSPHGTPHNDRRLDLYLKKLCQVEYEKTHTREEFIALIGRSYL